MRHVCYSTGRYMVDIEVTVAHQYSESYVCSYREGWPDVSPDTHICTPSTLVRYISVRSMTPSPTHLCITEIQVYPSNTNDTLTTWGRANPTTANPSAG